LNTPSLTCSTAASHRRTLHAAASLPPSSLLCHSNYFLTLEHSPRSPAIGSSPIINTMAKHKTSSRVAAKKKGAVKKPQATQVTRCVAAMAATQFVSLPSRPSGVPAQANPSDGNEGSIHPDANHGVTAANPNQSTTCTSDLGVEQGTADGDMDVGGDQFFNSDDKLDVEKSKSEDEEEGNDAEHAPQ
jgi:hypothetical protein